MESRFDIVSRIVAQEMAKPYVPGVSDCFFFGIRVVDALDERLGLERKYAGAYKTIPGAQRALRRRGHTSLVGLFEAHLETIGPAQARVGDIGIILLADGEHVGINAGQKFLTKTDRGQSFHDLGSVIAAFRVG